MVGDDSGKAFDVFGDHELRFNEQVCRIVLASGMYGYVLADPDFKVLERAGRLVDWVPVGNAIQESFPFLTGYEDEIDRLKPGRYGELVIGNVRVMASGLNEEMYVTATVAALGGRHGMLLVLQDVSQAARVHQRIVQHRNELHLIRDQLAQKNRSLRAILDHALDAIMTCNRDGVIESFNPAAERLFQLRATAAIGRSIASLLPEFESIREAMSTDSGDGSRGETAAKTAFGGVLAFEYVVSPMSVDGTPHLLWIGRDAGQRRQNEEKLRDARDRAEKANQAKSDYVSAMSHELRTPLNIIMGFAQLLDQDGCEGLSEQQRGAVAQILGASRHMGELINDSLDLAKIESGVVSLREEDVSLPEIIEQAIGLTQSMAEDRQVTIANQTGEVGAQVIRGDETRLRQIILNLLSNAVKYNRAGGRVTIEASLVDIRRVRLSITDTGPGILPQDVEHVFEPFRRFGDRTDKSEGTGIGLSITRRLVERMDGAIGFDTAVGEGSTFWIELPLSTDATPHPSETGAATAGDVTGMPSGTPASTQHKVLYVEDNKANQQLMVRIMGHLKDVTILLANNGADGVALAVREQPDLVLMDINLPDFDGITALAKLREAPETAQTVAVAVSAAASPTDVAKGMEAGFAAYLTKPLNVAEVLETVQQMLGTGPR